jgi:RNA polymerase sigma-70 factor (ECF subfamily)
VTGDHQDDLDLVTRARDGDPGALEALLDRHLDRVRAICWRITGNHADAEDATQDALIAIVRGLPRFDGRSRFTTWAYRVATNACLDELRRRKRRPVVGLPEHESAERPALGSGGGSSVAGQVADRIDVDAALGRLSPEFRAAVVLRDLCELDYAEVADVLGIPAGTVRSRIARGRAQLAEELGNQTDPSDRPSSTT